MAGVYKGKKKVQAYQTQLNMASCSTGETGYADLLARAWGLETYVVADVVERYTAKTEVASRMSFTSLALAAGRDMPCAAGL